MNYIFPKHIVLSVTQDRNLVVILEELTVIKEMTALY